MRTITLTLVKNMRDCTRTEYDADTITSITPVSGDDQPGTKFMLAGSFEVLNCRESPRQVREMIAEAQAKEEVQLDAETVNLLLHAVKSPDGAIHFIPCDGEFGVKAGDFDESFTGRERIKYKRIRNELKASYLIISGGGGRYDLTERGYALGDHLAAINAIGQPFHGLVKLPPAPKSSSSFTLNQNNYNRGDVNNAISERGAVIQKVGPKETET
jgi:hypothetical protein